MPADTYATARGSRIAGLAGRYSARARQRRYEIFLRAVDLKPGDTVLDLGCGAIGLGTLNRENPITGVDLLEQLGYVGENRVRFVQADTTTRLPFEEDEFEVVFSNSLVEHLPLAGRGTFAEEVRRVGRRYFVQTPARSFPLEPHYLVPLVQFMPDSLARQAVKLGPHDGPYERIRLLDRAELAGLFPGAEILTERAGPLIKSYMAVGGDLDR